MAEDNVYLQWGTDLVETRYDESFGSGAYQRETEGEDWRDFERSASREESIPLKEEQLQVERQGMRERGRVRVHKTVKTEDRHFTVPVKREQVIVEREPGRPGVET